MEVTSKIRVLDAEADRELYSEIVSNPNVEVQANETLMPKSGEPLIVLKYTETTEAPPELKTPFLGF